MHRYLTALKARAGSTIASRTMLTVLLASLALAAAAIIAIWTLL